MMKLAFTTTFDARNIINWSGTPHHMIRAFEQERIDVQAIGNLKRQLPQFFKLKQFLKKTLSGQRESPRFNVTAAKHYSLQIANRLKHYDAEAILAPQINPIAYLDSTLPMVLWTDALYASLLNFYPCFQNHSPDSILQGNLITKECLSRCKLVILSSEWAAKKAIEHYEIHPNNIKIVPFGANMQCHHTFYDIQEMVKNRSQKIVKLLFIGKHWERKGGDIVFRVANALHSAGQAVELNFIGCYPPKHTAIPHYIHCHGFIDKNNEQEIKKITALLRSSHFLFVPSRAEAYGIVFCEANAYGIPCITSRVGGINTIIKDNINGMTFDLNTEDAEYCDYIINIMKQYSHYEELALSAFNEYQTRLNWQVATRTVKQFIQDIL